eukprot:TRINITY_DN3683_c0_g2_i1.p2 TRINITY_DN3683_c0_g2~~TRINITY_DN3683_c0_g2_i1.p2  ORF type:complete len:117 (-),score=13.73 TRINITY_DN3683_c0_g2_i1:110-460(-)
MCIRDRYQRRVHGELRICLQMSLYSSHYPPKRYDYPPVADYPYLRDPLLDPLRDPLLDPLRDPYWANYWRDYHHKEFVLDREASHYWDTYWNLRYRAPYDIEYARTHPLGPPRLLP